MRFLTNLVRTHLSTLNEMFHSSVNDKPALEAIYEGYTPATGAPCILNSLHTSWCVGYQPPKLLCIYFVRIKIFLALTLLMLRVLADNPDAAFSLDHLAFFTDRFH